jgi:ABC-type uncharacterized transport system permease subunit
MLAVVSTFLYLYATFVQGMRLKGRWSNYRFIFLALGYLAIVAHADLLHHWIDVGGGQNLSLFNLFSLISWLVALLVLLAAWAKPVESLAVFVFPLAALSIILAICFPDKSMIDTAADPKQLFHILLATATFGVLCVAGLQAVLLAIMHRQLHHKQSSGLFQKLPPLETLETLLFQLIRLGFILLTLLIITSIYFFHQDLLQQNLQKTLLAVVAWTIFAILLLGRYFLGWRGRKAIYYTLSGVMLLMILYYTPMGAFIS